MLERRMSDGSPQWGIFQNLVVGGFSAFLGLIAWMWNRIDTMRDKVTVHETKLANIERTCQRVEEGVDELRAHLLDSKAKGR